MSLSSIALEKMGQKKSIVKTATISTINIGLEDFPETKSLEELQYSCSHRPLRRLSGSMHSNMPATSKAPPRHTIQINKSSSSSEVNSRNVSARCSNPVFYSLVNKGKKFPLDNLARTPNRDISTSEAPSRQVFPCCL